jgi:cell wall-associated NlpC family hydrolase
MNGIHLPRDADQQTLAGREISTLFSPEGLEKGDLLFFGSRATETEEENVTHVAMYVGDGNYIHSAGYRERVSINSMDSLSEQYIEHYPDIFIRTVRILGESGTGFGPIPENPMYREIIPSTQ